MVFKRIVETSWRNKIPVEGETAGMGGKGYSKEEKGGKTLKAYQN